MTKDDLYHFISRRRLGVLGSLSPDGAPQGALVGIAITRDLEIIFDTVSTSRKYSNLVRNPSACFVIGWEGEATVQYEGLAREPKDAELARYQEVYFATWPECRAHLAWPTVAYFVVAPKWIRYSDYDQSPPQIEEFKY